MKSKLKRAAAAISVLSLFTLATAPALADDDPGMTWAMGLFGLFWLAVLALMVVGLVLLARNFDQVGAGRRERDSARFILDERYAHGEIDQDEYLARKRHLP